jgi:Raf kinase inhibitor-like YbhB/YbcL family protein
MHLYQPVLHLRHIHIDAALLWKILLLLALLLAAPFLAGCRHHESAIVAAADTPITLTSASLQNGQVPRDFTCDGDDKSPALTWQHPPDRTEALVLTVVDPDAPGGNFTHWVLFNVPANTNALPEGVPKQGQLANGSRQGKSDFGQVGYNGPCPPAGKAHRYVFTLYALDTPLELPAGAPRSQVEAALQGHILAHGALTALYGR